MGTITLERNVRRFVFDSNTNPGVTWSTRIGAPAAGGGTGTSAWDPIETAVADNATVTMVQPGAAYLIPRKSGNNRALLDCTALLASPGVSALIIGESTPESTANGDTTYGPSVYVPVDQPGWLADLSSLYAAVTVTDYSGSPCTLTFDAPAVTITLDEDYGTALAVLTAIVAQFTGASAVTLPQIIQNTGSGPTSALRTTAVGDAAVFTFNAGASTAGELTDWFTTDAVYIDGWSDYPVGLNGKNIGTGELGAILTTHLWTDDVAMDYVHSATLVSLDGETIQATSYKYRPEALSFTPEDTGDWPEYDFGDTPANFSVAQALNILGGRSAAGGDGARARAFVIKTSSYTADPADGVIALADPGDFNLTLPATGFTDGQELLVFGGSPADTCMVVCPDADLYLLDGTITGGNIIVSNGQVLAFTFFTAADTTPSWRLTYDSNAAGGTGDVVGPASVTDGVPALFDGTTGKLIKAAAGALGTAAFENTGAFEAAGAVTSHAGATDPHGDRAYADGLVGAVPDEITTVRQAAGTNQTLGTSAVALASVSVPALGAGDNATLCAWGSITNTTGGTVTYTPSVKFGSTTLSATGGTIASGATMNWYIEVELVATSTSAQEVLVKSFVNNSNTSRFNIATMAETTTGAVTLDAQITSGSSSANQTGVRKQAILRVTRA